MADIKSIVCMATAFCLIIGFVACGSVDDKSSDKKESTSSTVALTTVATATATTILTMDEASQIPEMVCSNISFDNGEMLFANSEGTYTLIDANHRPITSLDVVDDCGNTITISCKSGKITFKSGAENCESFKLNKHLIEYTNNVLYYDKSKVEYKDKAFSVFKLTDDYSIVCIKTNKFRILDNSTGKKQTSLIFTDDIGVKVTLQCDLKGISALNSSGLREPCLKINGKLMVMTDTDVIVNGIMMYPAGYYDIALSTTTTTTTTKKTTTTTTTTLPPDETTEDTTTTTPEVTLPNQQPLEEQIKSEQEAQTSTTDTSNENVSDVTIEMLGYVNEVRRQYGLNDLYGIETLDGASQIRADELIQSYSHTRPDGTNYDTITDQCGMIEWKHIAENIATGTNCMSTAKEAFNSWINSEGHRANILNPDMKYMAVSKSTVQNGNDTITYWEQLFYNDDY